MILSATDATTREIGGVGPDQANLAGVVRPTSAHIIFRPGRNTTSIT
jgi:hypothetical protein